MDFKILSDLTLDYGKQDQLFVMRLKIGEHLYIQVDSRSVHVGRIQVRSSKEADVMLTQIMQRMSQYTCIQAAFNVFDLAFQFKAVRPFMFLINNMNRVVYFNDIWKMQRTYCCTFNPENTDIVLEDKTYNRTIEVSFPGLQTPLGAFKAEEDSYKFRFEVSNQYLWYIP
jgi:hypothetical protein